MGNITNKCCGDIKARITILGIDEQGKRELYERIAKTKIENINAVEHYEKSVKLNSIDALICYVPASNKLENLWSQQAVHSDGVIFVVDYHSEIDLSAAKKSINELYWNVVEQKRNIMLVMVRNGYSLEKDELNSICDIKDKCVMVSGCEFESWNGVDDAILGFCKTIKINK